MSKILASIADAERFSNLQTIDGFYKSSNEIKQRATAARAEHAEIVAMLCAEIEGAPTEADFEVGGRFDYDESCGNSDDVAKLYHARCDYERAKRIRALLSRVGGGA